MTTNNKETIKCMDCGEDGIFFIDDHLKTYHGMTMSEYLNKHGQNTPIASDAVWEAFKKKSPKRKGTAHFKGQIKIGNIRLERCEGDIQETFERPDKYQYPRLGAASRSIERLARAIKYGKNTYVYGPAGCGKSAAVRAICHDMNLESSHYPMRRGLDPELYLGKEAVVIDEKTGLNVTRYIKGKFLLDLEGRVGKDGIRRGVVILIDDFDRAPASYHEIFRHILEDNAKNIFIPELGVNINVHPETRIIVTANSAGRGDNKGYYTSVEEMDESILDRFERVIEFHFLENKEELEILKNKFPLITANASSLLDDAIKVSEDIRTMVQEDKIYASFSHRRLVLWLQSASELLLEGVPSDKILRESAHDWLEWFDEDTRSSVIQRVLDARLK